MDEVINPCPKCGAETDCGYGLAGGGIGVYFFCTADGCEFFSKTQDPPEDESGTGTPDSGGEGERGG